MDITGNKFGLLTAIEKRTRSTWYCECVCGGSTVTTVYKLLSGHTKSCGCTRKENFNFKKHEMSKTHLYQCYHSMIKRCKFDKSYIRKGINVCDEWLHSFESFKEWAMNNGYNETLTLERINVYSDYKPENCKWIPKSEQPRNKSTTIYLTYNNITKSLYEWSNILGIPRKTIYMRYYRCFEVSKILNKNMRKRMSKL